MKHIKIYQENNEPIDLIDESDDDTKTLVAELTNIFKSNYVHTIEVEGAIVLIRPSAIESIVISDIKKDKKIKPKKIQTSEGETETSKFEGEITD